MVFSAFFAFSAVFSGLNVSGVLNV